MTVRQLYDALQSEMSDNGTGNLPVRVYDDRAEDFVDVTGIEIDVEDGVKFLRISYWL